MFLILMKKGILLSLSVNINVCFYCGKVKFCGNFVCIFEIEGLICNE